MAKFHINKNGVAAPCKATKGNCPYGGTTGNENHYDSLEEAQEAAYELNMTEFGIIPNINNNDERLNQFNLPDVYLDKNLNIYDKLREDINEIGPCLLAEQTIGVDYYELSEDMQKTWDDRYNKLSEDEQNKVFLKHVNTPPNHIQYALNTLYSEELVDKIEPDMRKFFVNNGYYTEEEYEDIASATDKNYMFELYNDLSTKSPNEHRDMVMKEDFDDNISKDLDYILYPYKTETDDNESLLSKVTNVDQNFDLNFDRIDHSQVISINEIKNYFKGRRKALTWVYNHFFQFPNRPAPKRSTLPFSAYFSTCNLSCFLGINRADANWSAYFSTSFFFPIIGHTLLF